VWDARDGANLATLVGHSDKITACVWAGGEQQIVTSSRDGTGRLWRAQGASWSAEVFRMDEAITAAAYCPSEPPSEFVPGRAVVIALGCRLGGVHFVAAAASEANQC